MRLASFIAVLEGAFLVTGDKVSFGVSSFWIRIFAVCVRHGRGHRHHHAIPVRYQPARFSDAAGNVISPLLTYEDLMAFFLEASFLGVLLFGRTLVPRWAHFSAALMVAIGTLMSSFWILSANSWMQTPAGYKVIDGRFFPTDWMAIVFNPSFPYRLAHNVTAF